MSKRRLILACSFLAMASVVLGVAAGAALSRVGEVGATVTCLSACGEAEGALAVAESSATETPIPNPAHSEAMISGPLPGDAAAWSPACLRAFATTGEPPYSAGPSGPPATGAPPFRPAQAVFAYFKIGASIGTAQYDGDLNANGIQDGIEYDRSELGPGSSGPPDGIISAADAQLAFAQFKLHYRC